MSTSASSNVMVSSESFITTLRVLLEIIMSTPFNVICFTNSNYTNMDKEKGRKVLNYLWKIAFVLFFIFLVFGLKYKILYNSGDSMTPTIVNAQMIVMERYWNGCYPDRLDIVVIKSSDDGDTLNKRIVGMPDEILEVRDGIIYINDKRMNVPYVVATRDFSV